MRVLVTGAYGLIGSAVLTRLHRDGHELVGAGRAIEEAQRRLRFAQWIEADFARLRTAQDWRALLAGIDAVVNCVGVLQDGARDDVQAVQVEGTCALFDACAQAGIRRVIHISAIGAAADGPTPFSRTKAQADAHLSTLDLDWTILRPALVLAPAAYGGTAMLRGLAGIPLVTPVAGAASQVQVVSVDDVAATIAHCLRSGTGAKATWELAHPQVLALGDVVSALRSWHGFAPQPLLRLPAIAQGVIVICAEIAGLLGWRSPARSTALIQLTKGVVGDPSTWMNATGVKPKSLDAILAERPANVQDRWFARLYLLKPVAIVALAAFWIASGVVALGPGRAAALEHLTQAGLAPANAELGLVLGSLIDIALGFAVCVRRLARRALQAMMIVPLAYLLIGTIAAPQLWADPLGPYVKIIPVLLATCFTLAILDER